GIVFLLTTQWHSCVGNRSLQTTDDASLRADVTPLSTKISGIVSQVAVGDYQRVKAGELLVQIKDDDFRAQVEQAEATVRAAQATQLKADLSAKEAALKLARVNLDYTRIVAPTDGVVGERKVRPGQLVSAGTQVISLVGQTVWVIANYKETQLARVRVGDLTD